MPQYKEGRCYSFEDLEFYACCGMVRVVDNREAGQGKFRDVEPGEFFTRAESLFGEVKNQVFWDEKWKFIKMAQQVEECCKQAVEQGNPLDPRVRAFHLRHREYRRKVVQSGYGGKGMIVAESGLLLPERTLV